VSGVTSLEAACDLLLAAAGGMDRVRSWFNQRTFSPDRRAKGAVNDYAGSLWLAVEELRREGATAEQVAEWQAGFVKRWLAYQHAGSRTLNWMITGPARFPVDRNNKRMETERKRGDELSQYIDGRLHWLRRRLRKAEIHEVRASDKGGHKETAFGEIRLIENTALDRIQIVFPGKPTDEQRALLKSKAFKWAPSLGVWQRQLTNNARWAAEYVLQKIAA